LGEPEAEPAGDAISGYAGDETLGEPEAEPAGDAISGYAGDETLGEPEAEPAGEQPAAGPEKRHHARRGSFLVIGDWGYDVKNHYENLNWGECVKAIAQRMDEKFDQLGDVKFVINVGDSFYPSGVASKKDPQWQKKWRDVFSPKLRSVPWFSVYGNHDLHIDPCACTDDLSQCAQINADATNLDFFVMPNYTYYTPFPELDMEIIGMDMNYFMPGWDNKLKISELGFPDCQWTPCKDTCKSRFAQRMGASVDLFFDRVEHSKAKNLLVFSHYPTDYFTGGAPWLLDGFRNKTNHDIFYFGGHRHSTDTWSTCSIAPNVNWLVGGGGGYSCDSDDQGFVVGEIHANYSVETYAVLVDKEVCCLPPTTTSTSPTAVPLWT